MASSLETILLFQVKALNLPGPVAEYRFDPARRWRFDFAWPDQKVAVECEGATWAGGRHTRGAGFEKDCEKYNAAAISGWQVLRFTRTMIESGQAIETISKALEPYFRWETMTV